MRAWFQLHDRKIVQNNERGLNKGTYKFYNKNSARIFNKVTKDKKKRKLQSPIALIFTWDLKLIHFFFPFSNKN